MLACLLVDFANQKVHVLGGEDHAIVAVSRPQTWRFSFVMGDVLDFDVLFVTKLSMHSLWAERDFDNIHLQIHGRELAFLTLETGSTAGMMTSQDLKSRS